MSNFWLGLLVRFIKSAGASGLREYAEEFVAWLRVQAADSETPVDDAVVEMVAVFLGVK